ncbi:MAG: antibiotic biosynthesis monooxygenase family protein [Rubrobacteraceae bacterium]
MILEVALLDIVDDGEKEFERAFEKASAIISSMPGYISHELQRCVEAPSRYILLVRWRTLEDHTVGFRNSEEYAEWRRLLHHFYDPFPSVQHFEPIHIGSDS